MAGIGRFVSGVAVAALVLPLISGPASAHAFGQRYDLPAPLWMYLSGAGAAVALSFFVMILTLRRPVPRSLSRVSLSEAPIIGWLAHPGAVAGD